MAKAPSTGKILLFGVGIPLGLLALLGLTGTLSAATNLKINPTGLQFKRFSAGIIVNAAMEFILRLEMRNPSRTPLKVDWMEIRPTYEGRLLGIIRKDSPITIPPNNQPTYTSVDMNIPVASFGQTVISQIMAGRIPTHLDIEISASVQNTIVRTTQRVSIMNKNSTMSWIEDGGTPILPGTEPDIP